jgi:hypothetical protein
MSTRQHLRRDRLPLVSNPRRTMSNIDQAIRELEYIESDHRRERRIRWIDYGLQTFWMVTWVLVFWIWSPFIYPSFKNSRWTDFLTIFAVYFGSAIAIFGSKLVLDRLFKTGRTLSFRSYLASLVIPTIVLVIICTILIVAASKAADYLF